MTETPAPSGRNALKLSRFVRELGYDGSPLPLAEWSRLRETIRSLSAASGSRRTPLPPAIVLCARCGAETIKAAADLAKHEKRGHTEHYCSNTCWGRQQNFVRHAVRGCPGCGTPLHKGGAACSLACAEFNRQTRLAATRARYPVLTCLECNTQFAIERATPGKETYCSAECAARAHSRRMSGAGNPKWKDGASPARQQPHSAKAFRDMKPRILDRDGRACVVCSAPARDARLEVHHLDNWPMNNAASNLVTLCSMCHRKWHAAWDTKPKRILWPWLSGYASRPLSTTSR